MMAVKDILIVFSDSEEFTALEQFTKYFEDLIKKRNESVDYIKLNALEFFLGYYKGQLIFCSIGPPLRLPVKLKDVFEKNPQIQKVIDLSAPIREEALKLTKEFGAQPDYISMPNISEEEASKLVQKAMMEEKIKESRKQFGFKFSESESLTPTTEQSQKNSIKSTLKR